MPSSFACTTAYQKPVRLHRRSVFAQLSKYACKKRNRHGVFSQMHTWEMGQGQSARSNHPWGNHLVSVAANRCQYEQNRMLRAESVPHIELCSCNECTETIQSFCAVLLTPLMSTTKGRVNLERPIPLLLSDVVTKLSQKFHFDRAMNINQIGFKRGLHRRSYIGGQGRE